MLGEGAVMLILEDLESAQARGAKIYGEIAGYGSSMNAYRMTDPPPDGGGVTLAMDLRAARTRAWQPEDIQYVSAHGTSHARATTRPRRWRSSRSSASTPTSSRSPR